MAVASTGVGWVAGQRIKSPAEIASETAPPTPSLITVPVESRVLSSTVIVRGTVTFDEQTDISVTGAGASGGSAIITRVPLQPGDQLTEGAVLAEISGRPVIALQGDLPVFRNLTPGLQGPDVAQLEAALIRLGYDPGSVDTNYDAATETAVEALYRDLGYAPKVRPSTRRQRSKRPRTGCAAPGEPSHRRGLGTQRRGGELDPPPTRPGRRRRRTAAGDRQWPVGDRPHPGRRDGRCGPERLQHRSLTGQRRLPSRRPGQRGGRQPRAGPRDQRCHRPAGHRPGATGRRPRRRQRRRRQRQLDDARAELADANDDLARLDALIGVSFPAGEVVFLPMLPRQVQAVPVVPGDALDGPVMTVSGSGVVIDSAISVTDRALVEAGAEAIVDDDGLGIRARATITVIADNPGGDASNDRYAMRLEPLDPLPDEAFGRSLRVSIPIESTGGEGARRTPRRPVRRAGGDRRSRSSAATAPPNSSP
ncbi:MAG: peptidoglycan-binding domain-containing protein [Acidimicrobiales bacterium]